MGAEVSSAGGLGEGVVSHIFSKPARLGEDMNMESTQAGRGAGEGEGGRVGRGYLG